MKKEIEQNIEYIAEYYGFYNQSQKTMEECAELIQAISKFTTEHKTVDKMNQIIHIVEELADVQIMIKELIKILDCEKMIKDITEEKVNRQLKRIQQQEKNGERYSVVKELILKMSSPKS